MAEQWRCEPRGHPKSKQKERWKFIHSDILTFGACSLHANAQTWSTSTTNKILLCCLKIRITFLGRWIFGSHRQSLLPRSLVSVPKVCLSLLLIPVGLPGPPPATCPLVQTSLVPRGHPPPRKHRWQMLPELTPSAPRCSQENKLTSLQPSVLETTPPPDVDLYISTHLPSTTRLFPNGRFASHSYSPHLTNTSQSPWHPSRGRRPAGRPPTTP